MGKAKRKFNARATSKRKRTKVRVPGSLCFSVGAMNFTEKSWETINLTQDVSITRKGKFIFDLRLCCGLFRVVARRNIHVIDMIKVRRWELVLAAFFCFYFLSARAETSLE